MEQICKQKYNYSSHSKIKIWFSKHVWIINDNAVNRAMIILPKLQISKRKKIIIHYWNISKYWKSRQDFFWVSKSRNVCTKKSCELSKIRGKVTISILQLYLWAMTVHTWIVQKFNYKFIRSWVARSFCLYVSIIFFVDTKK